MCTQGLSKKPEGQLPALLVDMATRTIRFAQAMADVGPRAGCYLLRIGEYLQKNSN
jgi:hypothetical protein